MKAWLARHLGRTTGVDCHEVGVTLQRYLDGDIDGATARRIEAHLKSCLRCGLELEAYRRIKATLAAHRPEVPPESVQRLREFGERLARGELPVEP